VRSADAPAGGVRLAPAVLPTGGQAARHRPRWQVAAAEVPAPCAPGRNLGRARREGQL